MSTPLINTGAWKGLVHCGLLVSGWPISVIRRRKTLATRVRGHQIVGAVIDDELSVMFAAVLDGEHPQIRIVHEPLAPRGRLVQASVALLLNYGRTGGDRLLNELHDVGLRLESFALWVVAFAKVGPNVRGRSLARHNELEGRGMQQVLRKRALLFLKFEVVFV